MSISPFETDLKLLPSEHNPATRDAEIAVSDHAIRMWCSAVGEDDPVHVDIEAARGAGYDDVVAPEAMLQTWTMPIGDAAKLAAPTLHSRVRQIAHSHNLSAVVATDYEQQYLRPIHPGDVLKERSWIEYVSPAKQTSLGTGHFVSIAFEIRNQNDDTIGTLRARTFYFDPTNARPHAANTGSERPSGTDSVELPTKEIVLTRTLIISASLASNDHEPVHHDHILAREQGLTDIIASIVTTAGLVNRYVGVWAGTGRQLKKLSLRLAQPAYPDDTLTFTGRTEPHEAHTLVLVEGRHSRGVHVFATVELEGHPGSQSHV